MAGQEGGEGGVVSSATLGACKGPSLRLTGREQGEDGRDAAGTTTARRTWYLLHIST